MSSRAPAFALLLSTSIAFAFAFAACGGSAPSPEVPAPDTSGSPTAVDSAADSGSTTPATSAAPATSEAPASSAAPAGSAGAATAPVWKDMSREQRLEFMKTVVTPKMDALFKAQDGKKYAKFGCETCHGPGVQQDKYDMPNAGLPPLDFEKMKKESPDMMKFMDDSVTPTVAELLGKPRRSKENPDGFGCGACHTMAKKKAK